MYHSFLIHSFTTEPLGCFQHLAIVDPPQNKRPTQIESEGMEKNIPNKQGKKAGVAILISDKIGFKTKTIKRETEDTS